MAQGQIFTSGQVPVSGHNYPYQFQYPSLWYEASGLGHFDGIRFMLHHSQNKQSIVPMVWESGPLLPTGLHQKPGIRIDILGGILGSTNWRPGRLPLEILEYDPVIDDGSAFRWRLESGFLIELPGGWTLYSQSIIDSDRTVDPTARINEYDEIEASIEIPTAVIRYNNKSLQLQLGRQWQRWGPGLNGSLVIGDYYPPADGVAAAFNARTWSARYFFVRLDDFLEVAVADTQQWKRYLSAHRLDIQPHHNWRIGLTETALIATDGPPPFWALNPLLPWALVQQETGATNQLVNIMWSADAAWTPHPSWSLYGQFLVDDFQIDQIDRAIHPDQLGWLAGFSWQSAGLPKIPTPPDRSATRQAPADTIISPPSATTAMTTDQPASINNTPVTGTAVGLGVEYTHLNTWTYIHRHLPTRYQAWQATLAHPQGPDSEAVTGYLEWRQRNGNWRLLMTGRWVHRGRIDLDTAEYPVGHAGEPFPSPPTSQATQLSLLAAIRGPRASLLEGRLGWQTRNGQTNPPEDSSQWYATISLICPLWIAQAFIP